MGTECKEGESSQSPSSKFTGLRMRRESRQMFTGQELSLSVL